MKSIRNIIFYVTLTIAIITNISNAKSEKNNDYEQYFKDQDSIYEELLKLDISGARPLNIDKALTDKILEACPKNINNVIFKIKQKALRGNQKNIILHGLSGTGKSSIAQAIAIESQSSCLFFNTGCISTEYMNSGVQNLKKIFQHAKRIEGIFEKPCIVILDELEALTRKHIGKSNHENNILISFWQELDKLKNNNVMFIGTMNNTEDLPAQVTARTSMIEIPLPDITQKNITLSHHLKTEQKKYDLIYPNWTNYAYIKEQIEDNSEKKHDLKSFDALKYAYFMRQTNGFSHRDIENVVIKATDPALSQNANKIVSNAHFAEAIKQIKTDSKRIREREAGTLKHAFKAPLRDPKLIIASAIGAVATYGWYCSITNQQESLALQKKAFEHSKEVSDKQMSFCQIAKQAATNSVITEIIHFVFSKAR